MRTQAAERRHTATMHKGVPWLFLVALTVQEMVVYGSAVVPATVRDEYGNVADEYSLITWACVGCEPVDISLGIDLQAMAGELHKLATGFVNVCFNGPVPWDQLLTVFSNVLKGSFDGINEVLSWAAGYVTAIVIGLLTMAALLVVAVWCVCSKIFCKKAQRIDEAKEQGCCCASLCAFSLAVACIFTGAGMICAFYASEQMAESIPNLSPVFSASLTAVRNYVSTSVKQISDAVSTGFTFASNVVKRDLDNFKTLVGENVLTGLIQQNGSSAFDTLLASGPRSKNIADVLASASLGRDMATQADQSLDALKQKVGRTLTTCGSICSSVAIGELRTIFDPKKMPNFDGTVSSLRREMQANMTEAMLAERDAFYNIPTTTAEKAQTRIQEIKAKLTSYLSQAEGGISDIDRFWNQFNNYFEKTTNAKDLVDNYSSFDKIRRVLVAVILFLVLLVVIGQVAALSIVCCCGVLLQSLSASGQPSKERNTPWASRARTVLMMVASTSVAVGWFLCLAAVLSFAVGAPINKMICQWIRDPELPLLQKFVDGGEGRTSILGGEPGTYELANLLLSNSSIPLTASRILKYCRAGKTLWETFYFDSLVNLEEVTNYRKTVDLQREIDTIDIDLSTVTIVSDSTRQYSQRLTDIFRGIDVTGPMNELVKPTMVGSLTEIAENLEALAATVRLSSTAQIAGELESEAAEARALQDGIIKDLRTMQDNLRMSMQEVQNLPVEVSSSVTILEQLQKQLHGNSTALVREAAMSFGVRLRTIADGCVRDTIDKIHNVIAKCNPLWQVYENVFERALCGNCIDQLDQLWFSLGWCAVFFLAGMCLSFFMAKKLPESDAAEIGSEPEQKPIGESKDKHASSKKRSKRKTGATLEAANVESPPAHIVPMQADAKASTPASKQRESTNLGRANAETKSANNSHPGSEAVTRTTATKHSAAAASTVPRGSEHRNDAVMAATSNNQAPISVPLSTGSSNETFVTSRTRFSGQDPQTSTPGTVQNINNGQDASNVQQQYEPGLINQDVITEQSQAEPLSRELTASSIQSSGTETGKKRSKKKGKRSRKNKARKILVASSSSTAVTSGRA